MGLAGKSVSRGIQRAILQVFKHAPHGIVRFTVSRYADIAELEKFCVVSELRHFELADELRRADS